MDETTETIIEMSGKMKLIDRLLPKLQAGGHKVRYIPCFCTLACADRFHSLNCLSRCRKSMRGQQAARDNGSVQVLIFSQMTKLLTILEDYLHYREIQ